MPADEISHLTHVKAFGEALDALVCETAKHLSHFQSAFVSLYSIPSIKKEPPQVYCDDDDDDDVHVDYCCCW